MYRLFVNGRQTAEVRSSPERTLPSPGQQGFLGRPWRDYALFAALVGPNLVLLVLFTYRPVVDNIRLSFFDWNIADPAATFVGNTVVFTAATVVGSMVAGLALAVLLDRKLHGRNLVRSSIFAPFVISGAAIGVTFQFVFDPRFGLIQDLLHRVGVDSVPDFYQDPHWALFMVTVTYMWKNLGYTFVIYLAALQGTRRELAEAAEIDGASGWTTFRRVVLPQLRPTTYFLSITVMLGSLQVFDIVNVMTRGGPLGAGTTIMFLALLGITVYQVRIMDHGDGR
ncbi:carbohydrate ABC transporter permease [Rhodococcus pseudokoreensis]|uniref:carbohydrate ABC transporter permease n=1 Tax=Rhodococcus pseudokoreensis TaxID=2811421 RepID=UPI003B8461B2